MQILPTICEWKLNDLSTSTLALKRPLHSVIYKYVSFTITMCTSETARIRNLVMRSSGSSWLRATRRFDLALAANVGRSARLRGFDTSPQYPLFRGSRHFPLDIFPRTFPPLGQFLLLFTWCRTFPHSTTTIRQSTL